MRLSSYTLLLLATSVNTAWSAPTDDGLPNETASNIAAQLMAVVVFLTVLGRLANAAQRATATASVIVVMDRDLSGLRSGLSSYHVNLE
ncbi:hypothetical protein BDW59DRAFT_161999 [Aspergillus cavernicola]|uniref:Uncharacterized protein n=1 Tax=Aspergillus cavernicola TaxID=176166 RepID=A0ABR4IBC7_9EURO